MQYYYLGFFSFLLLLTADHSKGFGGKFGIQKDRQDESALGYDSVNETELHPSQTDMKKGFGGKFGVETERQDEVSCTKTGIFMY